MRQRLLAILTAIVLLSSLVASPVAAQRTSSEAILLNQETERLGQVTVDGQRYELYRYNNGLPYASGVVVYADGEEVTSEAEVESAVEAFARQRAVERLGSEDLAALRAIRANVSAASNVTERTLEMINETTSRLGETQTETNENGTSTGTGERTALARFESTHAPELRKNLREWQTAATALRTNTTDLVTLLERRRNGTSVDATVLYREYIETIHALETFSDRSRELDEDLAETATVGQEIAVDVYSTRESDQRLAMQFVRTSHRLESASSRLATITKPVGERRATLVEPRDVRESTETRLMNAWHSRQGAAAEVYGTIVGVPLLSLGIGGVVYWRRQ